MEDNMKPAMLNFRIQLHFCFILVIFAYVSILSVQAEEVRHRLIVLADMGNEPDEKQQMVHMHMYANEIEIEGLIAVTGKWLRTNPRPDIFTDLINEYAKVVDNLKLHAMGWPDADYLHAITVGGQNNYGIDDVGAGKSSDGSRLITEAVLRDDPRPLNIVVNAGSNTLAQALWDYRDTHTEEEVDAFVAKLRVYENGSQDNAGAWIVNNFPDIHWMRSNGQTYQYMGSLDPYCWEPYPKTADGQHEWANEHIQTNHGPLGAFYPDRIFGGKTWTLEGGGTTPWLGLVNQGLYSPDHQNWGGWGGRFSEDRKNVWSGYDDVRSDEQAAYNSVMVYDVLSDSWRDTVYNKDYNSNGTPVFRWRRAHLNDFKARMDWCVKDFANANHNPVINFNGDTTEAIVYLNKWPDQDVVLDASASTDPDGDPLTFQWYNYPEVTTYNGSINISDAKKSKAMFKVPSDANKEQIHIILEVTDVNDIAHLTSYRRIVIDVDSDADTTEPNVSVPSPEKGSSYSLILQSQTDAAELYYDASEPAISFAAQDIKRVLNTKGTSVTMKALAELPSAPGSMYILVAKNDAGVLSKLMAAGGQAVGNLGEQDYALRVTSTGGSKGYWAVGGDRVGAMYGGIHIAEIIAGGSIADLQNEDQSPYIAKRGLKFNIPLDDRQPSHDDRGTAAQTNIVHMWDFAFWQEYLDELARQRYNVLSLWNKHPFPSMVKLADYPNVALDDVYNNDGKVREMTIDEKIALWIQIMDYAWDRGIEIYIITWNIHMNGASGKHGISENENDNDTKDYLRKSVKQIFLTYPRLAGIGVTAGENMNGMSDDQKEQWLWDTYGKGVQDVKQKQPNRHIRFIHRYWWTSFDKINSRFSRLNDGFDMSFKYVRARIYSAYNPPFAEKELLPKLPAGMKTWWNIRNDDIYNLRWGDPEYVKQFILHFPKNGRTAGYYMGSDRYAWGRESISKNPTFPRQLENSKHWYSFLLWGRLGYDPQSPTDLLKGLIKYRFPTVSSDDLFDAWKSASEIIPLVNRFHWWSWDYLWWPEAGISTGHGAAIDAFHTVRDFISTDVMDGSGLMTIPEYTNNILNGQNNPGITPLQVADQLEVFAALALAKTSGMSRSGNRELAETIGDIRAMAYLGNYYANKIRGAIDLTLFEASKNNQYKNSAVSHLEQALVQWRNYVAILDDQYIKMEISMQGVFDWDALAGDVENDISIARNAN